MRPLRKIALLCAASILMGAPTGASAGSRHGQVRVQRDAYGVPHITATSTYGIFYGFGYALAEDQLYQLDILRRTAQGRVSEVLGKTWLANDRDARSQIDLSSLAAQYRALSADDKDIFRGFADGINARIRLVTARRSVLMPRDFIDAGFSPELWQPVDIIALYEHSMAKRFSDLNSELDNLALLTRLRAAHGDDAGWRLFNQLRWESDDSAPTTIAAADQHDLPIPTASRKDGPPPLKGLSDAVLYGAPGKDLAMLGPDDKPHASNAWLAGPGKTTNGDTVLINGPQMGDYATTYLWAAGLHGAGFDVVGSGPVGSPYLLFGTNGDIGWGATAGLGDTVDMYQEQLSPADPHRYRFDGRYQAMAHRTEIIKVKDAPPETLTVYATVHGTVDLFDQQAHTAYARKRSWTGSEVASLVAWVHAMKAHDYAHWRARMNKVTITVNHYYADRNGNIAYQFLGRFPRRPATQDFRLPAIGDGSMEWRGFYPQGSNPHVLNPAGGTIANWNNKPQPAYHNSDFMYWSRVDRVTEIDAQIAAKPKLSPQDLWNIVQATSSTDVTARYFIDLVRAHRQGWDAHGRIGEAAALIAGWDGTMVDPATGRNRPAYILYKAFLTRLLGEIYAPVLPGAGPGRAQAERDFLHFDPVFPSMGVKIAVMALSSPQDSPLLAGRPASGLLAAALTQGMEDASARFGPAPAQWQEAAARHVFSARNYAGVPQTTQENTPSLPLFMNRGTQNDRIVFHDGKVSFCDVTPPGESGFVAPDGQASAHRGDQLELYRSFACKQGWNTRVQAQAHAVSTEMLRY